MSHHSATNHIACAAGTYQANTGQASCNAATPATTQKELLSQTELFKTLHQVKSHVQLEHIKTKARKHPVRMPMLDIIQLEPQL